MVNRYSIKEILNFSKKDLESAIANKDLNECQDLECKSIVGDLETKFKGSITKETHIVAPIVGFLNSFNKEGLLILGLKTESRNNLITEIVPIKDSTIKNEEHLENIILGNIAAYKNSFIKPNLNIKMLSFDSGNVFLIHVKNQEISAIYLSKISNNLFIRNNGSTNKLGILEGIQYINSQVKSELYLDIDGPINNKFSIFVYNKGFAPGKYVSIVIKSNKKDISFSNSNFNDISHINDSIITYQMFVGYPPNTSLIYPNFRLFCGYLIIDADVKNIDFDIIIHEEKTYTQEKISLIYDNSVWSKKRNYESSIYL